MDELSLFDFAIAGGNTGLAMLIAFVPVILLQVTLGVGYPATGQDSLASLPSKAETSVGTRSQRGGAVERYQQVSLGEVVDSQQPDQQNIVAVPRDNYDGGMWSKEPVAF